MGSIRTFSVLWHPPRESKCLYLPFKLIDHLSGDQLHVAGVAVPREVLVDADDVDKLGRNVDINVLHEEAENDIKSTFDSRQL